jgi:hypothetical protein
MVARSGKCIRLPDQYSHGFPRTRRARLNLSAVIAGVIELTYLDLESCCLQSCVDSWRLPQEADGAAGCLRSHAAAGCEPFAVRPEHCCAGASPSGPCGSQATAPTTGPVGTCAQQDPPSAASGSQNPSGGGAHGGSPRAEIRHQFRPGNSIAGTGGQAAAGGREANSSSQPRMALALPARHSGRGARISPAIPTGHAGVGFAAGL